MDSKEDLIELLRWLGHEHIELKTAVLGLKGLLVDKGLVTPEELEQSLRDSRAAHLAAAQLAGTSQFQELERLLRKL